MVISVSWQVLLLTNLVEGMFVLNHLMSWWLGRTHINWGTNSTQHHGHRFLLYYRSFTE